MEVVKKVLNRIDRLVFGPPVRDRVVVKVVDRGESTGAPPCFVIGVYRSGTTLLRYILDSHSQIAVPPESNFLNPLADMWRSEWVKKGLAGVGVDDEGLLVRLRSFSSEIFEDYAAAKGKTRWVDKTPGYIEILDFLDALYSSDARYIMLYRHGLDVANSMAHWRERKVSEGTDPAARADENTRVALARYWAERCRTMLDFEAAHPEQCFRIKYEQIAQEPESVMPGVFQFLGEEWEPEVLDFNKKQHDFGLQDNKIANTKGFTPSIRNYEAWNEQELDEAKAIAGDVLETLGYSV